MASPISETVPLPKPSPVPEAGFENQSEKEAPSGRVIDVANQNAKIGFMLNCHQPIAGIADHAGEQQDRVQNPRFSVVAVKSPAAVPSANVPSTAAQ